MSRMKPKRALVGRPAGLVMPRVGGKTWKMSEWESTRYRVPDGMAEEYPSGEKGEAGWTVTGDVKDRGDKTGLSRPVARRMRRSRRSRRACAAQGMRPDR